MLFRSVELHMHTQMSTMDATASASDLIKQAAQWGHPAVAITDHGVVQAFPEAFGAAKKNNIKLIPGCEGYLIDDSAIVVENSDNRALEGISYVVLDVETTGLNKFTDMITEIGAVRIENGREAVSYTHLEPVFVAALEQKQHRVALAHPHLDQHIGGLVGIAGHIGKGKDMLLAQIVDPDHGALIRSQARVFVDYVIGVIEVVGNGDLVVLVKILQGIIV